MTETPEPISPPGLDGAEVFVRADAPDSYGRWYVRGDGSVVYQWPNGVWNESPVVSAETLRSSSVWARATE